MAKTLQKPIPKTPQDISKEQFGSIIPTEVRGQRLSANENVHKDISISLTDIDEAVLYYFENVIRPSVVQNTSLIKVPCMYANPEQWESVQKKGFLRDKNGKVMLPVISFVRTGFEKDRSMGNKLDGNNASLLQFFEVKYNKRNTYDAFSALNPPQKEASKQFMATSVPDYITLSYDIMIQTEYVEHSNKLVEMIEYASDSYWGDPNRFKFKARIESFNTAVEVSDGNDRAVIAECSVILQGYIIPDSINKKLSHLPGYFTPTQVTITEEVV